MAKSPKKKQPTKHPQSKHNTGHTGSVGNSSKMAAVQPSTPTAPTPPPVVKAEAPSPAALSPTTEPPNERPPGVAVAISPASSAVKTEPLAPLVPETPVLVPLREAASSADRAATPVVVPGDVPAPGEVPRGTSSVAPERVHEARLGADSGAASLVLREEASEVRAPVGEARPVREEPATSASSPALAAPVVARLGPWREDQTSRSLLYFLGVALLVSLVAWQVKRYSNDELDTSAFDLAQHLWAKNLGPHKAGAEGEDGPPASPTPGGVPGLGGGSPAATPDVNEEPPLPPPSLPGQDSAPFKGQAIEEGCRKAGPKDCEISAMDPFYHQLARVLRKEPGAVARISHFGDSILASDYVSSRARERLQDTFGDAGHGFLFIGQPSRWYFQEGVEHDSSSGWDARGITSDKKAKDGLYGLGGATFEAQGPGHKASFGTIVPKAGKEKPSQRFGQKVGRFEVYYLAQPEGGDLLVSIDGQERETLSTKGDAVASAFASYAVEDGAHTLSLKSVGGRVRAFGVVMERDIPGVVYDSMGLVSGSVRALLSIDEKHWAEQLKRRNPSLVILMYGTNEANYTSSSDKGIAEYEDGLREALRRVRGALPESACLLVAPPDTDEEKGGAMVTKSALPRMIEAQRRAALDEGCAYWDTFSWMGGKNSMAGWVKRGFGQSDYAHPTKKGAAKIGDAFVDALLAGYGAYAARAGATP